jgi:ketosteroid isomerase-like protein
MDTDDLEQLRRDVQHLKDRTEILDCLARHARGHDRHDAELLTSTYHEDGVDEHGYAVNAGPQYAEWANAQHAASSLSHLHNITTHLCEIDGDVAHCESYTMVVLLSPDGKTATIMNGRYLDRLEKRDGTWRIAVRRSTVDAVVTGDASMLDHPFFKQQGYPKGTRDRSDPSYRRPLSLDGPEPARW